MSQTPIDKSLSMKTLKGNCPAFPCCSAQLQNVPATKQWLSTKLSQNHKQNMRIKSYVACSLQMLTLSEKCVVSWWTHTHWRRRVKLNFLCYRTKLRKESYFRIFKCTSNQMELFSLPGLFTAPQHENKKCKPKKNPPKNLPGTDLQYFLQRTNLEHRGTPTAFMHPYLE